MQYDVIQPESKFGLPLGHKLLPAYLKDLLGYQTTWSAGHFATTRGPAAEPLLLQLLRLPRPALVLQPQEPTRARTACASTTSAQRHERRGRDRRVLDVPLRRRRRADLRARGQRRPAHAVPLVAERARAARPAADRLLRRGRARRARAHRRPAPARLREHDHHPRQRDEEDRRRREGARLLRRRDPRRRERQRRLPVLGRVQLPAARREAVPLRGRHPRQRVRALAQPHPRPRARPALRGHGARERLAADAALRRRRRQPRRARPRARRRRPLEAHGLARAVRERRQVPAPGDPAQHRPVVARHAVPQREPARDARRRG